MAQRTVYDSDITNCDRVGGVKSYSLHIESVKQGLSETETKQNYTQNCTLCYRGGRSYCWFHAWNSF